MPKLVALAAVHNDPSTSVRQIENETGLPKSTVHLHLKRGGFKSFKKQSHQKLLATDLFPRMEFCEAMTCKGNGAS